MASMYSPTYGPGPIPFMALALFHSWPWPYSIDGHGPLPLMAMAHSIHAHGPIPLMAKDPIHGQGPVAVAPYNCTWQNVAIYPVSHSPGVTPA